MQKSAQSSILIVCIIVCFHRINAQQQITNELPKSSSSMTYQNDHPLSKLAVDRIYNNNQISKERNEIVKLDTSFWNEYPLINPDSIASLKNLSANELAKQVLEIKNSNFYNNEPFNMLGSYSEFDARIDTTDLKKIALDQANTNVTIYDPGYFSNSLPRAHTDKCQFVNKSPDKRNSYIDLLKLGLGGTYSNLYWAMDLDIMRMFDINYSPELGVDWRIWDNRKTKKFGGSDDFKYYKAFHKDSTDYVVLVSQRSFNSKDEMKKNPKFKFVKVNQEDSMKIRSKMSETKKDTFFTIYYMKEYTIHKADNMDFKYLLINLKTKSIEKTGYYTEMGDPSKPNIASSYETSYKKVGNHYYLDQLSRNEFKFYPNLNHIELSGVNLKVDSIITDQSKIKKISKARADVRKESYIEKLIHKDMKIRKKKLD
jgi:hypothetical protein